MCEAGALSPALQDPLAPAGVMGVALNTAGSGTFVQKDFLFLGAFGRTQ